MRKHILVPEVKEEILQRISKLKPDSVNQWGKMNVRQMLRHLQEGILIGYGEIRPARNSGWLTQRLLRWMLLRTDLPAPKGKAKTFAEIDQVERNIDPPDFAMEQKKLLDLLQKFPEKKLQPRSPLIGKMNDQNWARQHYTHLDHHLRQFGV